MNALIVVRLLALGFAAGYAVERVTGSHGRKALENKLRDMIERDKHWNADCGWDVPAISVLDVIEKED